MLELRPSCECCDRDSAARIHCICSFEARFARTADTVLGGKRPNCGGELVARLRRPADKLASSPHRSSVFTIPPGAQRPFRNDDGDQA